MISSGSRNIFSNFPLVPRFPFVLRVVSFAVFVSAVPQQLAYFALNLSTSDSSLLHIRSVISESDDLDVLASLDEFRVLICKKGDDESDR